MQASEDGATWKTLTNANTICEHDVSWIGGLNGFPEDLCAAGIGGFTDYNASFPDPDMETFDLGAFAGKNIWLRFWYMTDWGTTYEGPFVDNVKVMSGTTTIFADDAESGDAKWTYAAPWQRSSGLQTFSHNFYLQWRNVGPTGGYDSGLGDARFRFGPANTGLLVWYNNNFYSDNEIFNYLTDYPGFGPKGRMLVVDSHPEPYRYPDLVAAGYNNEGGNLTSRGQMRDAPFSLKDSVTFNYVDPYGWANVPAPKSYEYPGRPAVSAFNDAWGYYPGAEFMPGGPVGQTSKRWMTRQWDASTVVPAKEYYGVKAPGYNGTDRFRFGCSLNAAGQVLCYSYATGLGYPGGSGNPGDQLAQYGWHVQIVSQTDSTAKLKIWNAAYDFDGAVTQTPGAAVVTMGTDLDVKVQATNIGGAVNAFFFVPISPNAEYVPGSAYGGAFPVTAGEAAQLAAKYGQASMADAAAAGADAARVVGVAYEAPEFATGLSVEAGFHVKVTASQGTVQHNVLIAGLGKLLKNIASAPITITTPVTETYQVMADTTLFQGQSTTNFGNWVYMYAGLSDLYRSTVKFDVSAIMPDYPVDKAILSVYVEALKSGEAGDLKAYEVTKAWAENTATWKAPWAMSGGDFDAVAAGSAAVVKADEGRWKQVDITALVQKWVADPTSNHGVLLRLLNPTNGNTTLRMTTNNYWYPQYRAKLDVSYRKP